MNQPKPRTQRVSFNLALGLGLVLLPLVSGLLLLSALNSNGELHRLRSDAELAALRRPLIEARHAAGIALSRLEATAYNDIRRSERSSEFARALVAFKNRMTAFEGELANAEEGWHRDTEVLGDLRRQTQRFIEAHSDLDEPHQLPEASWRFFTTVDWPGLSPAGDSWPAQVSLIENLHSIQGLGFDHFGAVTARLLEPDQLDSLPHSTRAWIQSIQASNALEANSSTDQPLERRSTLRIVNEWIQDTTADVELSDEIAEGFNRLLNTNQGMQAITASTPFLLGIREQLETSPEALLESVETFEVEVRELATIVYDRLFVVIARDLRQESRQRSMRFSALAVPGLLTLVLLAMLNTRRRRANRRLTEAAERDPLTRLPNRLALHRAAELELVGSATEARYASLLLLDVDNFKTINDTFGHSIGDGALVAFGALISSLTEDNEQVFRLGGDEFVVFCNHTEPTSARPHELSSLIRDALKDQVTVADHRLQLRTSCGGSTRALPTNLSELLIDADLALHEVKESTKSAFLHYRDTRRGPLIRKLRPMLEHRELQFAFQPQIDLLTGSVCGVEALCRWPSTAEGSFQAIDIIDSVEWLGHTDLFLTNLTDHVYAAQVRLQRLFAGRYWLNIWPSQLEVPDLKRSLLSRLSETDIDLRTLGIEITEKRVISDTEQTRESVEALRNEGVEIGLDDFGVFNSSIERLAQLPLDAVKVDRRLINGISVNREQRVFVKALKEICSARDLRLIAEGVETREDLATVADLGINEAQGFCICPALMLEDLMRFLEGWSPEDFMAQRAER